MAWKSNMKVRNSSAHVVKGRNPCCSQWPKHSVKTNRKCLLCDFARRFKKTRQLLFGFGKSSFWLISWYFFPCALKTIKFTDPTQFSQTFKALKSLSHFPKPSKDQANPADTLSTATSLLVFTRTPDAAPTCHQPAVHTAEECAIQHLVPAPPLLPPPRSTWWGAACAAWAPPGGSLSPPAAGYQVSDEALLCRCVSIPRSCVHSLTETRSLTSD